MELIKWNEILLPALIEAFTQPAVLKFLLSVIFLGFWFIFLRALLDRGMRKMEQKYPVKRLSPVTLLILAAVFFTLAFIAWKFIGIDSN